MSLLILYLRICYWRLVCWVLKIHPQWCSRLKRSIPKVCWWCIWTRPILYLSSRFRILLWSSGTQRWLAKSWPTCSTFEMEIADFDLLHHTTEIWSTEADRIDSRRPIGEEICQPSRLPLTHMCWYFLSKPHSQVEETIRRRPNPSTKTIIRKRIWLWFPLR